MERGGTTRPFGDDVSLLVEGRDVRALAAGAPAAGEVSLLAAGSVALAAATPFGPQPVAVLRAPALLGLHRALTGGTPLCTHEPAGDEGTRAVTMSADEARALLFDPEAAGQAFRRIALASVTAAIREVNAALARFFESAEPLPRPALRAEPHPAGAPEPADPGRVSALFDAAGLDPSTLPDLGLTSRSLPSGSLLLEAGTGGKEAFLVAEGRLRISMRIPGVGEEALAFLGPGEVVGEMALVDDAPRSADVWAHDGDTRVFVLSREVFRRLLVEGTPGGAPLLAGIVVALTRRFEESVQKAVTFRVLAGPF